MPSEDIRPLRGRFNELLVSSRRWKASWPAYLTWSGHEASCMIADISRRGARIRAVGSLDAGTRLYLLIDSVRPIAAVVAWRRDGEAGLCFEEPQQWVLNLLEASGAPVDARTAGRTAAEPLTP